MNAAAGHKFCNSEPFGPNEVSFDLLLGLQCAQDSRSEHTEDVKAGSWHKGSTVVQDCRVPKCSRVGSYLHMRI